MPLSSLSATVDCWPQTTSAFTSPPGSVMVDVPTPPPTPSSFCVIESLPAHSTCLVLPSFCVNIAVRPSSLGTTVDCAPHTTSLFTLPSVCVIVAVPTPPPVSASFGTTLDGVPHSTSVFCEPSFCVMVAVPGASSLPTTVDCTPQTTSFLTPCGVVMVAVPSPFDSTELNWSTIGPALIVLPSDNVATSECMPPSALSSKDRPVMRMSEGKSTVFKNVHSVPSFIVTVPVPSPLSVTVPC